MIYDLDKDGRLDFLIANRDSSSVSVFMGIGDGTFISPSEYAVGEYPQFVAIGDLNGDSNPDLAVACDVSRTVAVLLGTGSGAFAPGGHYGIHGGANAVAIGDLSGDAIPDIVATSGSRAVYLLAGNGDGTLAEAVSLPTRFSTYGIAVTDLDNDDRLDIVASNERDNAITVLFGNGDGTVEDELQIPMEAVPTDLAVADMNGDGNTDLIVANDGISLFLGRGDGAFDPEDRLVHGVDYRSVHVTDWNRDNVEDLALPVRNSVAILFGRGDGTFDTGNTFATGGGTGGLIGSGDLNSDGKVDLLTASGIGHVAIHAGNGESILSLPSLPTSGLVDDICVGDFNNDAVVDLAVVSGESDTVSVFLGHGDGTFAVRSDYLAGFRPNEIAAGDLNGDGTLDLAIANPSSFDVTLMPGRGDGTFGEATSLFSKAAPFSLAINDLDRDGRKDLITTSRGASTVSVWPGIEPGWVGQKTDHGVGARPVALGVGDSNNDGLDDLITANDGDSTLSVLLNQGNQTIEPAIHTYAGIRPVALAVGDINADGVIDALTADSNWPGMVSVFLGIGGGSFRPRYDVVLNPVWDLAIGHLDRDLVADVAAAAIGNSVVVLRGLGDGTFQTGIRYGASGSPHSVAVADFNGDLQTDIVVSTLHEGRRALNLMFGSKPDFPTATALIVFQGSWRDGAIEISWRFSGIDDAATVTLERSASPVGPWSAVNGVVRVEEGINVVRDDKAEGRRKYYYRIRVPVASGGHRVHGPIVVDPVAGTTSQFEVTATPNPAGRRLRITYHLASSDRVDLDILDIQGRRLVRVAGGYHEAGEHEVIWDGQTQYGLVSPGIYLARLASGQHSMTRRFVIRR